MSFTTMLLNSFNGSSAKLFTFAAGAALFLGCAGASSASTTCYTAWSASTVYTGGQTASESGVNYTAAFWTEGNNPATNNGPAGSGEPWISDGSCGSTNPKPPTTTSISRIFAPYVDMGTQFGEGVEAMQQAAGLKAITLAFLIGASDGSCSVGWGGYANQNPPQVLPNDTLWDGTTVQSIVSAMQKNGVQVIMSFGGSSAPDPAWNCSRKNASAATLQALYQSVITRYKVTMLDFDIEPSSNGDDPETDAESLKLRDEALVGLKAANPNLVISYTLPVTINGLDSNGMNVLTTAKSQGVAINTVNIMAMDYGKGLDDNGEMGKAAVSAATNTKTNLTTAGYTSATVGITPMIGENDPSGGYIEYFQLADVQTVLTFAEGTGSGYVSRIGMWSLNRDSGCAANPKYAPTTCSGISQTTNAFSEAFNQVK